MPNVKEELELSAEDFKAKYGRDKSFENEIIFHCHAGRRAANASAVAEGLGFKKSVWPYVKSSYLANLFILFSISAQNLIQVRGPNGLWKRDSKAECFDYNTVTFDCFCYDIGENRKKLTNSWIFLFLITLM